MTALRKYGVWLAMLWMFGLYGAASSGCMADSPPSDSVESSQQSDLDVRPACGICPLIHAQIAAGLDVDPRCAISCIDCGDGICNNGESHADCPVDCPLPTGGGGGGGGTTPVCGNGRCESGETIQNCREDCCRVHNPPCTV